MIKSNGMSSISTTALISSRIFAFICSKLHGYFINWNFHLSAIPAFDKSHTMQDAFSPSFSEDYVPDILNKEIAVVVLDDPFSTAHNYSCVYEGTVGSQGCIVGSHLLV